MDCLYIPSLGTRRVALSVGRIGSHDRVDSTQLGHHDFLIRNAVTRTIPARGVLLRCGGCLESLKAENLRDMIILIHYLRYTGRCPALELMVIMLAVVYGRISDQEERITRLLSRGGTKNTVRSTGYSVTESADVIMDATHATAGRKRR